MNITELYLAKHLGINCAQCGKHFKPSGQKRGRAPKYCSNACRQKRYRADKCSDRGASVTTFDLDSQGHDANNRNTTLKETI